MSVLASYLIAILAIIAPGFALAYALLGKTKLHLFEILVIGFVFGLIFPPTLTWFESYFMDYIHAFTFSAGLFEANAFVLTLIGIGLIWYQGMLKLPSARALRAGEEKERLRDIKEIRQRIAELGLDLRLVRQHEAEERQLADRHAKEMEMLAQAGPEERARIRQLHEEEERKLLSEHEREERLLLVPEKPKEKDKDMKLVWLLLGLLMLVAFVSRIANIGKAPTYFEFDPYFDMLSTKSILVYGYQYLHDFAAWPTLTSGAAHRMEPLIPYLEAFWYSIANPPSSGISNALLSYVSSFYPPITAALLVFAVFMFLYYEFGEKPALIGAALATSMPVLITTFIAGEQLLEPWGIFSMFFFYATYLLAMNNSKELRYAVLAGIAFASTFLGAHYFTVDAGVLALYIVSQGAIDVLRNKDLKDFYKANAVVIGIIAFTYAIFDPYKSSLFHRIPSLFGIPVIVSFPLIALILVLVFEYGPKFLKRRGIISHITRTTYYMWLALLVVLALIAVFATPIGNPIKSYIALSLHFTTPSSPLFMTVQEYEPTGIGFNFAGAGFGIIGINALVWIILILFVIVSIYAIFYRNSNASILMFWIVIPLAFAAMVEVKYLPHFGVAYILALSALIGELFMLLNKKFSKRATYIAYAIIAIVLLAEAVPAFAGVIGGYVNANNCTTILNRGNAVGYDMFCNQVPNYWLSAAAWMRSNVGPYGPRILSWWDYGDWINWFGNSNAVLRGDNAVPQLDYETAARYVLGPQDGFGPANLANFSNSVQAKYVLFDNALTQKWGALDFLACIDINQTSMAFAKAAANGTGQPYVLGTSQCEINHDPAVLLVPENTSSISSYCAPIKSLKNETLLKGIVLLGDTLTNTTYCVPLNSNTTAETLYYANGTASNARLVANQQFFQGSVSIQGEPFLAFMLLYLPNENGTVTAPSEFYSSNYYRAFYLGNLPGFKLVYPSNFTGINYINGTHQIMIYQLDNFTGTLPSHTPKPAWVHNNYTMPG
ncbi:MAG: hypothetical protein QXT43_02030 [Candidatus Micrarchaeaceae archaeon]